MRDAQERLLDILRAIRAIERHTSAGRAAFDADELVQTWVIHHLEIIGEAARGVSPDVKTLTPEVPWARVVGMRNTLIHGYFEIDSELVWAVVVRDLFALRVAVERAVEQLPGSKSP